MVSTDRSSVDGNRSTFSGECSDSSCDCCLDRECSCSECTSSTESIEETSKISKIKNSSKESNHESSESVNTIKTFEQLHVAKELLKGINKFGIFEPNGLQRIVLPKLRENRTNNFLLQSKSHNGKKTAYLISNLSRIDTRVDKTQVLIIAPTTELVNKIYESAYNIAKYSSITLKYLIRDNVGPDCFAINRHVVVSTLGIFFIENSKL